ncbi:MAG: 50S ribosome-binding GTPase [Acidobacteriaceae bacterium]|nr:50S ribosome-binding GTPase [Acidobacteriaceae bacterium]
MPANLTPEYFAAEHVYKSAETPQEKIAALEQMLASLPKHKGTEKMQADIKHRLAEARRESQKVRKTGVHSAPAYLIKREGAGQMALFGPPNAGKSQLVQALTHAHVQVADYPFSTRMPLAGMMLFEDVQIQLVDMPPICAEFMEPWLPQVVRSAQMGSLVVDANDPDVLGEIDFILTAADGWHARRPKLLVANKIDLPEATGNFRAIEELYGGEFHCLAVSALTGIGLADFARASFDALKLVRFYSKPPGKKADLDVPYVLLRGSTVQDAASHVHRDFAEHLKYARLFRKSHEHDGLMVERSHIIDDGDILEFHM